MTFNPKSIVLGLCILAGLEQSVSAQVKTETAKNKKIESCEKKEIHLKAIYRNLTNDEVSHKPVPRDQEFDLIPDWSEASGDIRAITKIPEKITAIQSVYFDKNNKKLIDKKLSVKNGRAEISEWKQLVGNNKSRRGKVVLTLLENENPLCEETLSIYYADAEN
ncbi:MAG: hypothetical protein ACXVLQ_15720 [Bacteriovorax sp.]